MKTAFKVTITSERERNLNSIQIRKTGSINVQEIVEMFIRKKTQKLFSTSLVLRKA